jgi:hypothetical protein
MNRLSAPEHFSTILEFAAGIADRGIPISLVLVEPDASTGMPESGELDALVGDFSQRVRRSDRCTRLTDNRFAALLVDCNRQGAMIFADRLQMAASGDGFARTISCGIATWGRDMSSHTDLLKSAERALRRAQEAGGDGIELHQPGVGG